MYKFFFIALFITIFCSPLECMQLETIDYKVVGIIGEASVKKDLETMKQYLPVLNEATKNHLFVNWIADRQSPEALQIFLDAGVSVHATNMLKKTALFNAGNSQQVVQLLLDHGALVGVTDYWQRTPLHCFASSYTSTSSAMELLIQQGADINVQDKNGKTPLHYAVQYKYQEKVDLLLVYEADSSIKDNDGKTPFDLVQPLREVVEEAKKLEKYQKAECVDSVVCLMQELSRICLRYSSVCKGQNKLTNAVLGIIKEVLSKKI